MVDNGSGRKTPEHDNDWGEEWESAFKAEEALLDDGGIDDIFDESWKEAHSSEQPPPAEPPPPASEDNPPDEPGVSAPPPKANRRLTLNRRAVKEIPLPYLLGGGILAIVLLGLFLTPTPRPPAPDKKEAPPSPVSVKSPTPPQPVEKARRKWVHDNFFIPVTSRDESTPPSFVKIRLTFIVLEEGTVPPSVEQNIRARELIYQFYQNRPLYELRRFALARGEMTTKLQSWITGQWPDLPLETVVFQHYEVI